MANFCLMPDKVNEFKKALKDKEISLVDLMNLDHADLVNKLKPYAGGASEQVATVIEEKLILKNKVLGLKNAIAKLTESGKYSPAQKAALQNAASEFKAAQMERIFNPKEGQSYLGGLADKIVGTHIDETTAQKVFELSKAADAAKVLTPKLSGVSDEYLQANAALNNFVAAQKPLSITSSIVKNFGIWGRNMLLANPSTPIKSFENQVVNSAFEGLARRAAAVAVTGKVDGTVVKQANAEAWDTFRKTNLSTPGMESMTDGHMLGKGEDFKLPTGQPTGVGKIGGKIESVVRNAAKISNKVVINWMHNFTFTKFYQKTFFDAANFTATKMAKGDTAKATEIFKDAARIEPQTKEGLATRMDAQRQAARVTSTNNTIGSDYALWAKNTLNKVGNQWMGGFPLGNYIIPIAKIPATLIVNKIYNAGVGTPFALGDLYKGYEKMGSEDPDTRFEGTAQVKKGYQGLARIVGAVALGTLLGFSVKKDDYRKDAYGNTFIRINGTWINMEYLSFLSPIFTATVSARFEGDGTLKGNASAYALGAISALKALPGFTEPNEALTALTTGKGWKYISDFFTSRSIPSFLSKITKPTQLLFGAQGVQTDQAYKAGVATKKAATAAKAKATRAANKAKK